jgi:hypothetical protein
VFISIEQDACNLVVIDLSNTSATHFPPNYKRMEYFAWDSDLRKIMLRLPLSARNQLGDIVADANEHRNNDTATAVFGKDNLGLLFICLIFRVHAC